MTICQTLALDYDSEVKNTRKLLELVPMDDSHRDYKPHPKSMSLERLATHVAELPGWPKFALESELLQLPLDFKPHIAASTAELLQIFDKAVEDGRGAVQSATDEAMQKTWTFKFGDVFSMTEPRPDVVRSFINHMIHHRAQLGVYLRLNGIPIPGMYGPSADEH